MCLQIVVIMIPVLTLTISVTMETSIKQRITSWDLNVITPPSPLLYCPAPIGIGTPYMERFTSALTRCAESHHVTPGTLISELLVHNIDSHYLSEESRLGGTGFYKSTWTLNGTARIRKCLLSNWVLLRGVKIWR